MQEKELKEEYNLIKIKVNLKYFGNLEM